MGKFSIVLAGKNGAGKTKLIQRFMGERYIDGYTASIGYDLDDKRDPTSKEGLKIGEISGFTFDHAYPDPSVGRCLQCRHAILLCIDLGGATTKQTIDKYAKQIHPFINNSQPPLIYLVFTKGDDQSQERPSSKKAKEIANKRGIKVQRVFYTSAKEDNDKKIQLIAATILKDCTVQAQHNEKNFLAADKNRNGGEQSKGDISISTSGKTNIPSIKNDLLKATAIEKKLQILEDAFEKIRQNPEQANSPRKGIFFNKNTAKYSDEQLQNISELKKLYVQCVKIDLYNKIDIDDEEYVQREVNKLLDITAKKSGRVGLVDFQITQYKLLVTQTTATRDKINELLDSKKREEKSDIHNRLLSKYSYLRH